MVYAAAIGGVEQLYLRSMDSFEAKPIPGTETAVSPFFSPDGQWIGFFAEAKLKKISVSGGAAVSLCDAAGAGGVSATWGTNGTIVFHSGGGALQEVSAAGGTCRALNSLNKGETADRWPQFLPGAKAVLFSAFTSPTDALIKLYEPKTGAQRDLPLSGTLPHYASSGHLLYAQGGTLMAVPFDLGRLEVTGGPVPVVEGVMQVAGVQGAQYSFSDNGVLAYIPGSIQAPQRSLVWINRKGVEQTLAAPPHLYRNPRISPDGMRVAVEIEELGGQVWIYDLGRDTLTRLTFEGSGNGNPAWTPDGRRVAFTSGSPGSLYWQPADGSGKAERLTTSEKRQVASSWSADGQELAFHQIEPITGGDLWVFHLSDLRAQPFLQTPFFESSPQFSPDGRWLAYASSESGRGEIYVQPYPGPGGKWQVSTDGGREPVWNRNGRELFYRNGDKMMAADVATQAGFSAGKPSMLFEGRYVPTPGNLPDYAVSPDGQRFLMLKPSESANAAQQINVVLNWFEEVKQKVPTGKK